jgi:hypothetical protein
MPSPDTLPSNIRRFPPVNRAENAFLTRLETDNRLRESVNGSGLIRDIRNVVEWLTLGYLPQYAKPVGLPSDPDKEVNLLGWVPIVPKDIPRLKVALDANLKLLNKVLPDLRSMDFMDNTPQAEVMSDLELAAKVAALVSMRPSIPSRLIDMAPSHHTPLEAPVEPAKSPRGPRKAKALPPVAQQPDWV